MASPATPSVAVPLRPVAALYIDPRGPYPAIPWGSLRHLNVYQDPRCALVAVKQVRRWGGVLEHPKGSKLWEARSLPAPGADEDQWGGFTVQVDQCAWGHVARKTTWLYVVGLTREAVEETIRTGGTPTHWVSGFRSAGAKPGASGYRATGSAAPPGIKICSAEQRRRTPHAFAEWLVAIARAVTR